LGLKGLLTLQNGSGLERTQVDRALMMIRSHDS
jgi:hypothetical protein